MTRHFIAWHVNGATKEGEPGWSVTHSEPQAIAIFEQLIARKDTNWVKRYSIRDDGRYLFDAEFQQRTVADVIPRLVGST